MGIFRLSHRVSHADVDFLGELKVAAMLGLLEQAAVEASTVAGFDAERYARENRVWIIRRTRLQRVIPVGGTDPLEIETAVLDYRRVRSLRRYEVRRSGQSVAQATTDWVYCDLASGRPARIADELQSALGCESPQAHERPPSLPEPPDATPAVQCVRVRPSHLDHVVHVNNGIYVHFLEDALLAVMEEAGWSVSRMLEHGGALRIHALDIEYLADAQLDDELQIRSWILSQEISETPVALSCLQAIFRGSTEILRARSDWTWRHRASVLGAPPR